MMLDDERLRRLTDRLPPRLKRAGKELLFRMALRSTDTFLVGHPKSGNTWLAYLLAIASRGGDPEGRITVANLGSIVPTIHGRDLALLKYRELPSPRIFRQEFPTFPELYPTTLYIVRDPRSVLVSYYHHYRVTTHSQTDLATFVARYLADGSILDWEPLVRWDEQVRAWTERARTSGRVMIVRYEDMHRDRRSVLETVTRFCRITAPPHVIDRAVDRSSFGAMRSQEEQRGAEAYLLEGGAAYRERPARFYREGRIDGWKDELPAPTVRVIEREFRDAMALLGYTALEADGSDQRPSLA
jgi:Sulfotransferase domain